MLQRLRRYRQRAGAAARRRECAPARAAGLRDLAVAGVLALLLFPFNAITTLAAAGDPAASLPDADQQCLGCHSSEGLTKRAANGDTLSLHVAGDAFARSVHKAMGCAACHSDIDLKSHPGATRDIQSARQHSIERAGVCRQCHEEAFKQHEGSVHAARVRQGSPVAPVCAGCHGSHSVSPRTAYETCIGCHAAALTTHRSWLPNAGLHLEVVSCAACHAPAVLRMIDLRFYDRTAKQWVSEKEGLARFEPLARSIDTDGNGLDPVELRKVLGDINQGAAGLSWTLRGRVELRTGVEAHQLSDKGKAIKDCESCHRNGAEPFRNVTVSVTGPDGRPVRYPAHESVLSAAFVLESLPEFYAIGGTRSRWLDVLFVLVLLGAAAVPIGHMTVRWLTRKFLGKGGTATGNPQDRNRREE